MFYIFRCFIMILGLIGVSQLPSVAMEESSLDQKKEKFYQGAFYAFEQLNKTCVMPYHGRNLPPSWEKVSVCLKVAGKELNNADMKLKEGHLASNALKEFFVPGQRPWTIDCGTAQFLAIAAGIQKVYGSQYLNDMVPPKATLGNVIAVLCDSKTAETLARSTRRHSEKGHFGYVANFPLYDMIMEPGKTGNAGMNVMMCGKNQKEEHLYCGFGPVFKEGPVTYEVIREDLIQGLLKDQVDENYFANHLRAIMEPQLINSALLNPHAWQQVFTAFYKVEGGEKKFLESFEAVQEKNLPAKYPFEVNWEELEGFSNSFRNWRMYYGATQEKIWETIRKAFRLDS